LPFEELNQIGGCYEETRNKRQGKEKGDFRSDDGEIR
jgi:hypothetical protein